MISQPLYTVCTLLFSMLLCLSLSLYQLSIQNPVFCSDVGFCPNPVHSYTLTSLGNFLQVDVRTQTYEKIFNSAKSLDRVVLQIFVFVGYCLDHTAVPACAFICVYNFFALLKLLRPDLIERFSARVQQALPVQPIQESKGLQLIQEPQSSPPSQQVQLVQVAQQTQLMQPQKQSIPYQMAVLPQIPDISNDGHDLFVRSSDVAKIHQQAVRSASTMRDIIMGSMANLQQQQSNLHEQTTSITRRLLETQGVPLSIQVVSLSRPPLHFGTQQPAYASLSPEKPTGKGNKITGRKASVSPAKKRGRSKSRK